jgi:hypothetical protein
MMDKDYWLFVNGKRVGAWGSLESAQAQARGYYGTQTLSWGRVNHGPQGNCMHWWAFANDETGMRHEYLIIEVDKGTPT